MLARTTPLPLLAQRRNPDRDEAVALLHQTGGYGRGADLDRTLPFSRPAEQAILADLRVVALGHVVPHAAQQVDLFLCVISGLTFLPGSLQRVEL